MATMPPEVIFFIKKVKTTTGKKNDWTLEK